LPISGLGQPFWSIMVLDTNRQELIIVGGQGQAFEDYGQSFVLVISMTDFTVLKNVSFTLDTWFPLEIAYYDPLNYSISWMAFTFGQILPVPRIGLISVDLKTTSIRSMKFDVSDIWYTNQIVALLGDGQFFYGFDGINRLLWTFAFNGQPPSSKGPLPLPPGYINVHDCTVRTDTQGQVICILTDDDLHAQALAVVDLFNIQSTSVPLIGEFGTYPFYVVIN